MNFNNLKKKSSFDKLNKELEKINNKSGGADSRFWQPEVDKAGNGQAVIRFLDAPQADGEDGSPWVQVFNHGFQGPGGWFIDTCLTTLGQGSKCPVCEENTKLWNSGVEANKDIVRTRKRKLNYISNILVVKDPNHPENEGKVFLYKYGKKIFDKLSERFPKKKSDGTYETHDSMDEEFLKFDPFNLWEGANFKLKIRQVEGYRNYDKSEFAAPSPVADSDEEIEAVWKQGHSLKAFVDPELFKSYAQLKARLDAVLGGGNKNRTASAEEIEIDEPVHSDASSEDTLNYFKDLAEAE